MDGEDEHFLTNEDIFPHRVTVAENDDWIAVPLDPVWHGYISIYKIINRKTSETDYRSIYSHLPIWSPNGHYLLYETDDGFYTYDTFHQTDKLLLKLDDERRYWSFIGQDSDQLEYEWSPDGKLLAIRLYPDIFVIQPDGNKIVNLTGESQARTTRISPHQTRSRYNLNLHWSPDGNWIVFQHEVRGTSSEIFRVRPDGSDMQNLTNDPNWDVMPSWIPSFEKPWHPEFALAGGVVGSGVILLSVFKRKSTG